MVFHQEKPFSCSRCDYRASQKEHIRRHLRTRHGADPGVEDADEVAEEEALAANAHPGMNNIFPIYMYTVLLFVHVVEGCQLVEHMWRAVSW